MYEEEPEEEEEANNQQLMEIDGEEGHGFSTWGGRLITM